MKSQICLFSDLSISLDLHLHSFESHCCQWKSVEICTDICAFSFLGEYTEKKKMSNLRGSKNLLEKKKDKLSEMCCLFMSLLPTLTAQ